MKFLIALWQINPNRMFKKFGRFMAGQELARKFRNEYRALEKEKPVFTRSSKIK